MKPFLFALFLAFSSSLQGIPAFPGAEGFGADATGGRGGDVYVVSNLSDSGAGSFRDAVSQPNRTVVFAVGGVIEISSRVTVSPNITIAGQTAPGEGITIYGNGVSFSGANNTICRFIRFRQGIGGDSGTDAVGIASGSEMIFDHVSASWGRDETFSVTSSASDVTLQDCIVAQGLLIHSAGGLMEPNGPVSVFRCLYADNWMRNPKVKGTHEFTNNVVYNWGSGGAYICGDSARESYPNIINNLFIGGVNSGTTPAFIRGNLNFHAYAEGNVQDVTPDGTLAPVAVEPNDFTVVDAQPSAWPYPTVGVLLTPQQSLGHVILHSGASLRRDSVDAGIVAETLSFGTLGHQIANESEVGGVGTVAGGLAPPDGDGDGMPDWWEMAAGLNLSSDDHNGDADGDGYTNLENYINAIAYAGVQGAAITGVSDDTGSFPDDGNTSDTTLVLNGTAEPGATVTLRRMGAGTLGTTTADGSGNWIFDYTGTVLAENYHVFFASGTIGGADSSLSPGFIVRVDTTPAAAPVITSLVVTPAVAFTGTAEPGAVVTVRLSGGADVATATADGLGAWTAPYTGSPLSPGVHSFVASAVDLAGNAGGDSALYSVDTSLSVPAFTGISQDTGSSSSDAITNDTTLIISGTAPAGSTVSVSRSDVVGVLASVAANGAGNWTLDMTGTSLPDATYTFSATAEVGGNSSPASSPYVVVVDTTRPAIHSLVRLNPSTTSTSASTLVLRVTMAEPVTGVDTSDFSLTKSPTSITGSVSAVSQVTPSVYDVTITGASGDGTIRLDRATGCQIYDYAGNLTNTSYTGGQSYTLRLPGSGVWINATTDGAWSDAANWDEGVVADGNGLTADFASLEISEDLEVALNSPRTLGRLIFGDADIDTGASWTLTGGGNPSNLLTLASSTAPVVQVNYSGGPGDSDATIAAASAAYPATLDAPIVGTQGFTKTGKGTLVLTKPATITGSLSLPNSSGYLRLGAGSSMEVSGVSTGTSSQLQVAGGTFTTGGTFTVVNGGSSGLNVSGGSAAVHRIVTSGDRDGIVRVSGGTLDVDEISLGRTSNSESEAATFSRGGLIVQGGSTTVGTMTIPSNNSWSAISVEGGSLTVSGAATLANQVTSGRGGLLRVTGGRLTVTEATNGLVLSKKSGSNANNVAKVTLSGGVTTLEKLTLGYDSTVNAGSATVTLNGGALFLGGGGIVKNGTSGMATSLLMESGVLGAKSDWSTGLPMELTGSIEIRTADEGGVPHGITLDGLLSGSGGFTKTGGGTLQASGANTFTGTATVSEGLLDLTGSVAGSVVIEAAGGIGGSGTIGGSLTLRSMSTFAAEPTTGPLHVQGALMGDGAALHKVGLPGSFNANAGDEFAILTFGSTDTTAGDFQLAAIPDYRAVFLVDASSLRIHITGAGPSAAYTHWVYLNGLPPGEDAPGDNPAIDGIANLLKFVLGLDPNHPVTHGIAIGTTIDGAETYPSITWRRTTDLGGVIVDVEVCDELGFATDLGSTEVSATDNGDGTETVVTRSNVPIESLPRQFLRIVALMPAGP